MLRQQHQAPARRWRQHGNRRRLTRGTRQSPPRTKRPVPTTNPSRAVWHAGCTRGLEAPPCSPHECNTHGMTRQDETKILSVQRFSPVLLRVGAFRPSVRPLARTSLSSSAASHPFGGGRTAREARSGLARARVMRLALPSVAMATGSA